MSFTMLVQNIKPEQRLNGHSDPLANIPIGNKRLNFARLFQQQQTVSQPVALQKTTAKPNNDTLRSLGSLAGKTTTVAQLLLQDPQLKSKTWSIIHDPINKNKAFTRIPYGSKVYFNLQTRELSWQSPPSVHTVVAASAKKITPAESPKSYLNDTDPASVKKLDEAVKHLMGTEYNKMDCYTLVVEGLKNMGVRYRGKGSLSSELLHRARSEGLAENAYFTGEGITEALGKKVYNTAISKVDNIEQQSRVIYQQMQQRMQKGDILSFSMQTRGHTGIISQHQDQWTYINSGRLDHTINQNAPRYGVGEEPLIKEISNWIKLAQKRQETLQITVGRLDQEKLV